MLELIEKLKKYADVKEVSDSTFNGDTLVIFDTDNVKCDFKSLYVSHFEFKIKKDLIDLFSIEPLDDKKIRVYLFLKKEGNE